MALSPPATLSTDESIAPRRPEVPKQDVPADRTTLTVTSADGASVEASVHRAADESAPVFVVLPAMGVRATFYAPLSQALVARGRHAVVCDLRGLGTSSVRARRGVDFGYREMAELDVPALLAAVRVAFPGSQVVCLGHSLGGQMACLASAALTAGLVDGAPPDGIVLVASCSVWYGAWSGLGKVKVWSFLQCARAASALLGYFPGHLVGFGGREARGVISDWARQGTGGRYWIAGTTHHYEALLATMTTPVLALSLEGDSFAPRRAVEHLLAKMPRTRHEHLTPERLDASALDHFGWVRRSGAVVDVVLQCLGEGDPARD